MARWAIGDVQGCAEELRELIRRIGFKADRDQLWFVGDLVNRGPRSLQALRLIRSMRDNAVVVLGNHDLHLLAVALAKAPLRRSDTLDDILRASDRDRLLEWLTTLPLAHCDPAAGDLLVHAGVVPQWDLACTLDLASNVERALRSNPERVLRAMYGDQPDRWRTSLKGVDRLRFTINVLTRLRFCTSQGVVDLKQSGKPGSAPPPLLPWFKVRARTRERIRIVFGHWSALGYYRGNGVLGLDTGCVWGGALTAANLDAPRAPPVSVPSRQPRSIE
jgi:bis(5'-nucleosyl)-tetraphosphatase (symmetrical)